MALPSSDPSCRNRLIKQYTGLGSCKWSTRQIGEGVLGDLYEARGGLGRRAATSQLVLFSRSGFTSAIRKRAEAENVILVEPEQLFEAR